MLIMNGGISFKVVRLPYWRSISSSWKPWWKTHICLLHYIIMQILFAKCNDNQHFLISISPSGSLIRLEGKMLANYLSISTQHFILTNSTNQQISIFPRPHFRDLVPVRQNRVWKDKCSDVNVCESRFLSCVVTEEWIKLYFSLLLPYFASWYLVQ